MTPRDTRRQIFLPHDLTDFFHPPLPSSLPTLTHKQLPGFVIQREIWILKLDK